MRTGSPLSPPLLPAPLRATCPAATYSRPRGQAPGASVPHSIGSRAGFWASPLPQGCLGSRSGTDSPSGTVARLSWVLGDRSRGELSWPHLARGYTVATGVAPPSARRGRDTGPLLCIPQLLWAQGHCLPHSAGDGRVESESRRHPPGCSSVCPPGDPREGPPAATPHSSDDVHTGPGPRAKLPPEVLQAAALSRAPTGRVRRVGVQPWPTGLGHPGEGRLVHIAPSFRGGCGGLCPQLLQTRCSQAVLLPALRPEQAAFPLSRPGGRHGASQQRPA